MIDLWGNGRDCCLWVAAAKDYFSAQSCLAARIILSNNVYLGQVKHAFDLRDDISIVVKNIGILALCVVVKISV